MKTWKISELKLPTSSRVEFKTNKKIGPISVLEITVGHLTLSDQTLKMSSQFHIMIGRTSSSRCLRPVQFEKCPTKSKIWKDIRPANKEKLFPVLPPSDFTWKRRAMCNSADGRFQSVNTSGATDATISNTCGRKAKILKCTLHSDVRIPESRE